MSFRARGVRRRRPKLTHSSCTKDCSSSPLLSTFTNASSRRSRMKKGSKRWMGASTQSRNNEPGTVTGEPLSSTLEQEIMLMLLRNAGNDDSGGFPHGFSSEEDGYAG